MLRLSSRGARRSGTVVLVVVLLLVSLLPTPAGAATWRPTMRSAREYAEQRPGSVSFATIGSGGVFRGYRAATSVPAASVLKVMFMVAYLRQSSVRDRELRDSDRDLLRPMIRRSDNTSATRIADQLGPGPMYRLAERAGMQDFSYTRPWGLSRTSARDQVLFLYELRRHLPNRHQAYALYLLRTITESQRWGIGQVDTPGWTKHFKGGWGSGSGAVDHQVVLLRHRDGTRAAMAVMTTSSPNHEEGKRTLRGVFARLTSRMR